METSSRLHFIDNLRATTMLVVVIFHVLMVFTTPDFYPWPTRDMYTSPIFNAIEISLHVFTMPLFFFVAGYVASRLQGHLGTRGFMVQRLKRIGVPFLICMLILAYIHTIEWLAYVVISCHGVSLTNCLTHGAGNNVGKVLLQKLAGGDIARFYDSTSNLWFLYYLLLLYMLTIMLLPFWRKAHTYIKTNWSILALIIAGFLFLWPVDAWRINTPTSFIPNGWLLMFYAGFFYYGWLAYRNTVLIEKWMQHNWIYWVAAVIILPSYAVLQSNQPSNNNHYYLLLRAITLLDCAAGAWVMIMAVSGFYLRNLNRPNRVLRYLADASYWIYLIQLPIIMCLQNYYASSTLPVLLKIVIIFVAVMSIALLSYQVLVRNTFVSKIIGSKRANSRRQVELSAQRDNPACTN